MKSNIKIISLLLIFTSIHSFLVGVGLILLPSGILNIVGFGLDTERFFRTQGGVFHIIMAIGYSIASRNVIKYKILLDFTIIVKFSATIFLLTYYFFVDSILTIFLSGLVDFFIGLVLLAVNIIFKTELQKNDKVVS
jgi:hypothetical protein